MERGGAGGRVHTPGEGQRPSGNRWQPDAESSGGNPAEEPASQAHIRLDRGKEEGPPFSFIFHWSQEMVS